MVRTPAITSALDNHVLVGKKTKWGTTPNEETLDRRHKLQHVRSNAASPTVQTVPRGENMKKKRQVGEHVLPRRGSGLSTPRGAEQRLQRPAKEEEEEEE
jgi:hypothetical protein